VSYSTTTNAINLLEPNSKQAIKFCIGEEVMLSLTEDGFYYQGRVINDEGEAYRLFVKWMQDTQKFQWPTLEDRIKNKLNSTEEAIRQLKNTVEISPIAKEILDRAKDKKD
jgi:hypothetical protein